MASPPDGTGRATPRSGLSARRAVGLGSGRLSPISRVARGLLSAGRSSPRFAPARSDVVAAVDLGSNSFHMIVARVVQGQVHVVDRIHDRVALAEGLDRRRRLSPGARRRALACLSRFGQRLRDMPRGSVRAVGTNALRHARDATRFLSRARAALGHPIEVISGREEARLIYMGVSHAVADVPGRRLVVDIGGGSTECVIGEQFEPVVADSLYMGCVNWSERYFPEGRITRKAFDRAQIAARLELETLERRYRALGWQEVLGSSGTILAVEQVLAASGWSRQGITPQALKQLGRSLCEAGRTSRLRLPGLARERAPVFPGGVAILSAIFESFGIERMATSTAALREGLLHDLLGRIRHEDVRDRTIRMLSERYRVDSEQAARVERTALDMLEQVSATWFLTGERQRQLLSWAARLHEIGLAISHAGHHKHGAYLIANSDMPGFSRHDQEELACLVRWHRRKIDPVDFGTGLTPERDVALTRMVVLLRLAVEINRGRTPRPLPALVLEPKATGMALRFPRGWLTAHPLTREELAKEGDLVSSLGFRLSVR